MPELSEQELSLHGFYRGQVLDNNDSLKLGRIKVNIFKFFKNIEAEKLPWAKPAMPLTSGSGVDFGYLAIPEIGSFVWCFFEEGDIWQPVYFAEAPSAVHGVPSEVKTNYPFRKIMKTKNGIIIFVDDFKKEVKVEHPSGSYIFIDSDGNIIIKGETVQINPL